MIYSLDGHIKICFKFSSFSDGKYSIANVKQTLIIRHQKQQLNSNKFLSCLHLELSNFSWAGCIPLEIFNSGTVGHGTLATVDDASSVTLNLTTYLSASVILDEPDSLVDVPLITDDDASSSVTLNLTMYLSDSVILDEPDSLVDVPLVTDDDASSSVTKGSSDNL